MQSRTDYIKSKRGNQLASAINFLNGTASQLTTSPETQAKSETVTRQLCEKGSNQEPEPISKLLRRCDLLITKKQANFEVKPAPKERPHVVYEERKGDELRPEEEETKNEPVVSRHDTKQEKPVVKEDS